MDESKPNQSLDPKKLPKSKKETHGLRDDIDVNTPIGDIKGPNVFERAREEFEAIVESIQARKEDKRPGSPSSAKSFRVDTTFARTKQGIQRSFSGLTLGKKETHGLRDDFDVDTPLSDIKGPNVFERVKEELEAIVDSIHPPKDDKNQDSPSSAKSDDSIFTRKLAKLKMGNTYLKSQSLKEKDKSPVVHHKETHGRGEDIDADIPINEFKGPSIFHRAKEEIEAIVDTIHTKKDSDSPKKEGGFRASVSKKLNSYSKGRNRGD